MTEYFQTILSKRSSGLKGQIYIPSDKSISHRALIMGSLAIGKTSILRLLESYDIFKTPLHPYTKGLIKSIPSLKNNKTKRLYSIKGHVPDKYKKYTGCVFSDRCNDFMKGKCDIIEPSKIKINKNQFVSCFLYK